jgi:hypothetical protein
MRFLPQAAGYRRSVQIHYEVHRTFKCILSQNCYLTNEVAILCGKNAETSVLDIQYVLSEGGRETGRAMKR